MKKIRLFACLTLLSCFMLFFLSCSNASAHIQEMSAAVSAEPSEASPGQSSAETTRSSNMIAYVSDSVNGSDIWLLDLDSGKRTNLTDNSRYMNVNPSFSPDGSKIVFSSNRDGVYDIWIMNIDGSGPKNLTNGSNIDLPGSGDGYWPYGAHQPSFSPDGTKIIYSSNEHVYRPDGYEFANCFNDIWIMNIDGSGRQNLTKPHKIHISPDETAHAVDLSPVFTPDGKHIVFAAYRLENDPQAEWAAIWIMGADGSDSRPLIDPVHGGYAPCISTDGTKITFYTQYEAGSSGNIWIMDADGSNIKNLTNHPSTGYGEQPIYPTDPCFSPDGSRIVFNCRDGDWSNLWIMDADGSNREVLLDLSGDQWGAVFKPSGNVKIKETPAPEETQPVTHTEEETALSLDALSMVPVPEGTYEVPTGWDDSGTTTVSGGFEIADVPVTYAHWHEVMAWAEQRGYTFQNDGWEGSSGQSGQTPVTTGQPVTMISYYDSIVWANAFSEMNGLEAVYRNISGDVLKDSRDANLDQLSEAVVLDSNGYRLPTSQEWELAARYIDGNAWTPGNHASGASAPYTDEQATYRVAVIQEGITQEVGTREPNVLGLYDMSGNIWEWTSSKSGTNHIVRGGLLVGAQGDGGPSGTNNNVGLRLVRDPS